MYNFYTIISFNLWCNDKRGKVLIYFVLVDIFESLKCYVIDKISTKINVLFQDIVTNNMSFQAALFSVSVSGLQLFNYFIPAPTSPGSSCDLSEAISRNGLVYFLIANVITGIVNMLNLPGVYVSGELPETTFLIFYSLTLCVIISYYNYINSRR